MSDSILSALRGGDAAQALALADAQLAESPEQAETQYWRALALQTLGRADEAREALDRAIALAPERTDFTVTRAVLQLGGGEFDAAQGGLMDALAMNPNQLEAYIGLIHIALGQNNVAEAKRLLKLAERVDAEADFVIAAAGGVAQAEGDFERALKLFTRAVEVNPKNVLALYSLGLLYLRQEMPAFAEQALSRALEAAPDNVKVMRALVQSQLSQERLADAERGVDAILAVSPQDPASLQLRMQLRAGRNDPAGAAQDARALRDLFPREPALLTERCVHLINDGRRDDARAEIRAAVDAHPDVEAFWQILANFEMSARGDVPAVIGEWLAHHPASALAHEVDAVYREAAGDLDAAAESAAKALAAASDLAAAQFVQLRHELRTDPRLALQRLEALAPKAGNSDAQRMVLGWFGIAHDRLGEYGQAASAFAQMARILLPNKPLPVPMPAEQVPAGAAAGHLLWVAAGTRVERVFDALSPVLGPRLLIDRNLMLPARQDGFGALRALPGDAAAGSAEKWRTGVEAMGVAPEQAVDWIPQWDAYTAAALRGGRLVALLTDPRDAYLNWMVFGSAQAYGFLPDPVESAQWLALAHEAVADTLADPDSGARAVRLDREDGDHAALAAELQDAFDVEGPIDAGILAKPVMALGGMPNQFPAGHWRHYKDAFAEAFALLTPAAVRLGYPQD